MEPESSPSAASAVLRPSPGGKWGALRHARRASRGQSHSRSRQRAPGRRGSGRDSSSAESASTQPSSPHSQASHGSSWGPSSVSLREDSSEALSHSSASDYSSSESSGSGSSTEDSYATPSPRTARHGGAGGAGRGGDGSVSPPGPGFGPASPRLAATLHPQSSTHLQPRAVTAGARDARLPGMVQSVSEMWRSLASHRQRDKPATRAARRLSNVTDGVQALESGSLATAAADAPQRQHSGPSLPAEGVAMSPRQAAAFSSSIARCAQLRQTAERAIAGDIDALGISPTAAAVLGRGQAGRHGAMEAGAADQRWQRGGAAIAARRASTAPAPRGGKGPMVARKKRVLRAMTRLGRSSDRWRDELAKAERREERGRMRMAAAAAAANAALGHRGGAPTHVSDTESGTTMSLESYMHSGGGTASAAGTPGYDGGLWPGADAGAGAKRGSPSRQRRVLLRSRPDAHTAALLQRMVRRAGLDVRVETTPGRSSALEARGFRGPPLTAEALHRRQSVAAPSAEQGVVRAHGEETDDSTRGRLVAGLQGQPRALAASDAVEAGGAGASHARLTQRQRTSSFGSIVEGSPRSSGGASSSSSMDDFPSGSLYMADGSVDSASDGSGTGAPLQGATRALPVGAAMRVPARLSRQSASTAGADSRRQAARRRLPPLQSTTASGIGAYASDEAVQLAPPPRMRRARRAARAAEGEEGEEEKAVERALVRAAQSRASMRSLLQGLAAAEQGQDSGEHTGGRAPVKSRLRLRGTMHASRAGPRMHRLAQRRATAAPSDSHAGSAAEPAGPARGVEFTGSGSGQRAALGAAERQVRGRQEDAETVSRRRKLQHTLSVMEEEAQRREHAAKEQPPARTAEARPPRPPQQQAVPGARAWPARQSQPLAQRLASSSRAAAQRGRAPSAGAAPSNGRGTLVQTGEEAGSSAAEAGGLSWSSSRPATADDLADQSSGVDTLDQASLMSWNADKGLQQRPGTASEGLSGFAMGSDLA